MAERLEIIITADDQASKAFKSTKDAASGLGGILKTAVGTAMGFLTAQAIPGLVSGLTSIVPKASDLNETLNKVNVVLGDAAGAVIEFSESSATSLGQSQQQALDAAATFAIFGKSAGLSGQDLADFSTDFTTLASDLASFNNTSPEEAIQAIGAALRGEAEPLRRYGVLLDDASMRQAALELGIVSTTKDALTPQQKVLAAQALIFKQTGDAQGDFARTSDGLANSQRIVAAQWEDIQVTIGTLFLPVVQKVTGYMADTLLPLLATNLPIAIAFLSDLWMNTLQPAIQTVWSFLMEDLIPAFTSFIASIQPVIDFITANLVPILIGVGVAILVHVIPMFITWATTAATTAAATVAAMLPVILPLVAIGAAVAVLAMAWKNNWGGIQDKLTAFWETTGRPIFETLKAWLDTNIPIAIAVLKDFWETVLLPAIQNVWDWINTVLMPFFQNTVVPFLEDTFTSALQTLGNFWTNTLQPAIESVWNWISTVLMPFLVNTVIPFLQETFTQAIQTLSDFWTNTLLPALTTAWAYFNDNILPIIQDVIDIMVILGEITITALAGFWENVLQPALETVWNYFNDNILPILEDVRDFIRDEVGPKVLWFKTSVIDPLASALSGALTNAISTVYGWLESLKKFLGDFDLPWWLTPGSPTPFENGLRGIGDALEDLNRKALLEFNANLKTTGMLQPGAGGGNNYNLTVNAAGGVVDPRQSFELMKALAGA